MKIMNFQNGSIASTIGICLSLLCIPHSKCLNLVGVVYTVLVSEVLLPLIDAFTILLLT